MKVLFIGGTGNISTACSRQALNAGIDLYHLTRGNRKPSVEGVQSLYADINNTEQVKSVLKDHQWDVVVNFIAFSPGDISRDYALFNGHTKQYVFISSASCYQTPLSHPVITESTPLHNPTWDYAHQKILCESKLMELYTDHGFPVTIVRPSHTYDTVIPIALGGFTEFTTAQRILDHRPIIIHGNGKSLWAVTHSNDFAKGFVPLLGQYKTIGHAFHITSDELLTWNAIYETLADALDRPLNAVHISTDLICKWEPSFYGSLATDKSECVIFDNSKIKSFVPEYKSTIPFAVGIRRTLAWFNQDSSRRIINAFTDQRMDEIILRYQQL
jgi:nucleoside-diphosphate-sugar epimerase